jgi:heat shock protein HspQ
MAAQTAIKPFRGTPAFPSVTATSRQSQARPIKIKPKHGTRRIPSSIVGKRRFVYDGRPARTSRRTATGPLNWPRLPLASATMMVYRRGMIKARTAKFQIGQIVRHRLFSFRGVIFDIDPEFNNTEEWWLSIPEEVRPHKDQPFYHLLAENSETEYVAYVSEQNLLPDDSGEPIRHSQVAEIFIKDKSGGYRPRNPSLN